MSQYFRLPGVALTPSGTQDVNLIKVGGAAISEGQKTMANSLPVVVASDQSALPVTAASLPLPSGAATAANQTNVQSSPGASASTALTVQGSASGVAIPVSASALPLPTGAATSALQTTGNTSVASIDTKTPALGQALAAASVPVVLTAAQVSTLTPLSSVTVTQATGSNLHAVLDAGSAIVGKVGIDQTTVGTTNAVSVAQLGANTVNTGNGTASTGTLRVAIASDNTTNTNPFLTVEQKATTSTLTNVASSASTVSVLASNASRKGAMIFNDSTATLYLKFGTTASTTSYTVQIAPSGYYEFPANPALYTGACDGIWSAANGNARVTELS